MPTNGKRYVPAVRPPLTAARFHVLPVVQTASRAFHHSNVSRSRTATSTFAIDESSEYAPDTKMGDTAGTTVAPGAVSVAVGTFTSVGGAAAVSENTSMRS